VEIADCTHAVYGNDGIDFGLPATTSAPDLADPSDRLIADLRPSDVSGDAGGQGSAERPR
jgi:hypothetical protein